MTWLLALLLMAFSGHVSQNVHYQPAPAWQQEVHHSGPKLCLLPEGCDGDLLP